MQVRSLNLDLLLHLDFDLDLAMLTPSFATPFKRSPGVLAQPSLETKINRLLQEAGRLHQAGELEQARTHYLDILALSGEHPQALFLWALVCFQLGDYVQAKHGLNQYLKQSTQDMTAWGLLGQCLLALGEHASAVEIFKNLSYLEPSRVEHLTDLARAYRVWGQEHWSTAREALDLAYALNPHDEKVLAQLSELNLDLGLFELALTPLTELCGVDPMNAHYQVSLGIAHHRLGQFEEAQTNYLHAIHINQANPVAHYNWGVLLQERGQNALAIEQYQLALRLDPQYFEVYVNLCSLLGQTQSFAEALICVEQALQNNAHSDELYFCKGLVLARMGRTREAVTSFEKTIQLNPSHAKAHWNLGLCELRLGSFERGWAEHEWRWQVDTFKPLAFQPHNPLQVQWSALDPSAAEHRVLVWAEQGLGDEVMFASLLPEIQGRVKHLSVEVDRRLISVMKRSMPGIEFLPRGQPLHEQAFDRQISMGSLAQWCRDSMASFESQPKAYLIADPVRVQHLRQVLESQLSPQEAQATWVGISWRSQSVESGESRSLDLSVLAKALHAPGVQLVNLQYGHVSDEIQACFEQTGIRIHEVKEVDNFADIDGLMALMKALGAVVSVDNVTVHLGGALGQPVLALLPHPSDWRWMEIATQSPWYPSVQLLRQQTQGDWSDVMATLHTLFNPS